MGEVTDVQVAWRSYIVEDAHSHGPSGRGGWVGHDVDTVEDE